LRRVRQSDEHVASRQLRRVHRRFSLRHGSGVCRQHVPGGLHVGRPMLRGAEGWRPLQTKPAKLRNASPTALQRHHAPLHPAGTCEQCLEPTHPRWCNPTNNSADTRSARPPRPVGATERARVAAPRTEEAAAADRAPGSYRSMEAVLLGALLLKL
jgi:hypothetical protein